MILVQRLSSLAALAVVGFVVSGCASSGAVKAAEKGDYAALKQHLADEMKAGKISGGEARAVAHAVIGFEVRTTKGDDAPKRISELRGCAPQAEGILSDRTGQDDEAGALAAYLLVDEHLHRPGKWASKASSESPHWRAVGARALVDSSQGDRRRELFLDVFTLVRQGALRAAVEAADPQDLGALLEAVRVDPDEQARISAAKGVGKLGGADAVLALKDRWFSASEPVRSALVEAWGSKASFSTGGRDQLFWVAETTHGSPAISAAMALLRMGAEESVIGRSALLKAFESEPMPGRVMAINLADLGDALQREAVIKASEEGDPLVKVAALGRMTSLDDRRAKALEELGAIAATDGPARNAARTALAKARDRRVVELLAADTKDTEPGVRVWAASELASMKEFPHAAQVLADDDASVRVRAACAILAVPRLALLKPGGRAGYSQRMRFPGSIATAAVCIASLLSGTGCIKSTLLKGQLQSTREASSAADTLHDYEVARNASYAGLVQFEGLHKLAPNNEDGLFLLAKGWAGAAFAFMEDDWEVAEDVKDEGMAEYHKQRALAAYERSIQYGLELLSKRAEGFAEARKNEKSLKAWLEQHFLDKEDAANLLWVGYAWIARTNVGKDDPDLVTDLWVGVQLVEHSVKLDETYAYGNGLTILAAYHARTAQAEPEESRQYFEKAFALTQGRALLAKFNYAARYLCIKGDKAAYVKTLQEIVDAGDIFPEQRLQNVIAKRRAKRYLGKARMANAREECGFDN